MQSLVHIAAPVLYALLSGGPEASPLPACSSEVVGLFEKGRYPDAARVAEQCFARTHHARLLYFAGQGHQSAGRHAAALHAYLEFIRDATDDPTLLTDARERVEELRAATPAVVLAIETTGDAPEREPQVRLERTDEPQPPVVVELERCEGARGARKLRLDRGAWRVEILLAGFVSERRHLQVDASAEPQTVQVTLVREVHEAPPVAAPPRPAPPRPTADQPPSDRRSRARLGQTITFGALGVGLAVAGSTIVAVAPRQGIERLANDDLVDRDLQFYSLGAGLLGASLGAGIGALTRHFARRPGAFVAEFSVGAAVMTAGWALFGVTSSQLRARDAMHPDPGWHDGGRIAASALAGLGMALIVTSVTSWISDRIERRGSRRIARRTPSPLLPRLVPQVQP